MTRGKWAIATGLPMQITVELMNEASNDSPLTALFATARRRPAMV
jgi:hypothetical protein